MTFNIHHGRGIDGKLNLDRIAKTIHQTGADLIGLNEVDRRFSKRSQYQDQITELAKRLKMEYAFGSSIAIDQTRAGTKGEYGNGLLSRFPIMKWENHLFQSIKGIENRGVLHVTVNIEGLSINVFVTQLSLYPPLHKQQVNHVLDLLQDCRGPAIVLGDWNMRPYGHRWRKMTCHVQDVWDVKGEGKGATFPSRQPRFRIDYIFVSSHFSVEAVQVVHINREASDHLPVLAVLRLID
ncbi:endonuclease/exonuclease/phosphatase family metal-dependent hydrolase [Caldalkalibacillus uzonensis]|uniref:Endonuclease/exonuclease/phosphatase family metal-dependent hydrolase n=1 Tax=Caldalkalibacillus uzonensis TaxID=353224 RepID=A0ABU0CR75_9BACI|nr:endonuclease/exonuclease/phosphatase family protein [Caldalkalibacillus uzonensis]MDQ0338920.1 endonuclease/exonuclease/phosphatase family metal-dependent hydrolase [Caldalkalibacillus uzonensis]